jgi:hypothetical protein
MRDMTVYLQISQQILMPNSSSTLPIFVEHIKNALEQLKIEYSYGYVIKQAHSNMKTIRYHVKKSNENIIDYKIGYYPNFFYFDNGGYSAWAKNIEVETKYSLVECEKLYEKFYNPIMKNTKYPEFDKSLPKKSLSDYLLLTLQIQKDSVLLHKNFSTIEMLNQARDISDLLEIPLLVKRHPLCKDEQLSKYLIENNFAIENSSITYLLDNCVALLTCNSGTGFEAVSRFKPVISFGNSDYQHMTHPFANATEAARFIEKGGFAKQYILPKLIAYRESIIDINDSNSVNKISNRMTRFK